MDTRFDFSLKRDRLYKQVADQLQDLIVADSLHPGERLPGERELADRMGVSRTVIREAIRVLSDRGLVRVKSGCGTYVRELSHSDAAASLERFLRLSSSPGGFRDVHEVRRVIEIEAAGLAAERATEEDLRSMHAAIDGMEQSRSDPDAYTRFDVAFHLAVASATHNDLMAALLSPIADLLIDTVRASLNASTAAEQGLAYHRDIIERITQRDAQAAREAMRDHLETARQLVENLRPGSETDSQTIQPDRKEN